MDEHHILMSAKQEIKNAKELKDLDKTRIKFLGKQGIVTIGLKNLNTLSDEQRKIVGRDLNIAKKEITELIENKQEVLYRQSVEDRFDQEGLDLSIPARPRKMGTIHPISQCLEELTQIFAKFGFGFQTGPNIETEWYNFTALNMGANHPARQMHDTFYLKGGEVLRTHTSPTQIRVMQQEPPPLRFIAPGRTYRSDSDNTHTPMFHQIEGMMIDKEVNVGHLKYLISEFIKMFFEVPTIEIRFRPSFFPFTTPSLEVDIRKNSSWLELLGCGMVHPQVLKNVGIEPDSFRGFAFGMGVDRFAMIKYGINDVRQFFDNDLRWLKHYNFASFDIPSIVGGLSR
ncbi:MAG: phenylalanine--tRNA ligase subunit alpha [Rickettsiaceae bacterium]|nr:MAG: phenylalanine--tRNA ligase subunit alpha [Rickettsiaceae bacterium]